MHNATRLREVVITKLIGFGLTSAFTQSTKCPNTPRNFWLSTLLLFREDAREQERFRGCLGESQKQSNARTCASFRSRPMASWTCRRHRIRDRLVSRRRAVINQIRAFFAGARHGVCAEAGRSSRPPEPHAVSEHAPHLLSYGAELAVVAIGKLTDHPA
jgi:hypothetical protein